MASRRSVIGPKKADARSRVTNGKEILPGIDGRAPTARRYRDIVSMLVADAGNPAHITEARMQLFRRFAAQSVLAELLEARLVMGQAIDITEHAQLSSTLVRIASRIGITRQARNIVPTIAEYIEGKKVS